MIFAPRLTPAEMLAAIDATPRVPRTEPIAVDEHGEAIEHMPDPEYGWTPRDLDAAADREADRSAWVRMGGSDD